MTNVLKSVRATAVVALGLLGLVSAGAAELGKKPVLTLEVAKALSVAAEKESIKNKWTMVIAIVDDGGHLIHLLRQDGTQLGSIDVALDKARTAVYFKRPTKQLEDAITSGRNSILALRNAAPLEGGVPLIVNGEMIGAVGVSGMQSGQDAQVAQAAVAALSGLAKK